MQLERDASGVPVASNPRPLKLRTKPDTRAKLFSEKMFAYKEQRSHKGWCAA
jgi:hypothetical protein